MSLQPVDSLGLDLPPKVEDYAGFIKDPGRADVAHSQDNPSRVFVSLLPEAEEMYSEKAVISAACRSLLKMNPPRDRSGNTVKTHREIHYVILRGQQTADGERIETSPSVAIFTDQGIVREHLSECESMVDG